MSGTILDTIDTLVRGDRANLAQFPSLHQLVRVFRSDVYIRQLFLEIIQGLVVVLQDHDFRQTNVAAQQLCQFFVENSNFVGGLEEKAISLSKYLLALPMSIYAQRSSIGIIDFVEEVALPAGATSFAPTGGFRRWYKDHLYCPKPANLHLWWSWYQVKRNTPTIDEKFVSEAYRKHLAMLTKPDPCPEGLVRLFGFSIDPVELIRPEIQRVAKAIHISEDVHVRQAPSKKACFAYGQNQGGQYRDVRAFLNPDGKAPRVLLKMDWFPVVRARVFVYNPVVETYSRPDLTDCAKLMDLLLAEQSFSLSETNSSYESFIPRASIYGICEPLKVRIISKGPGVLYWRCKPLQKEIWRALKEIPAFRLIGKTVDIIDVIDNTKQKYLASVDYSAATDGSSQTVGRRILTELLLESSVSVNLMESALAAFGLHHLNYKIDPDSRGFDHEALQTNGQLMGSIMSFPVLCLLNLAALRIAEFLHGYEVVDPLINGDDMLYSCDDPVFWEYQCQAAMALGLTPSVGKCYLSTHAFSINSVAFHRSRSGVVQRVNYLPTGLLHGKHKVAIRDTTEESEIEESLATCFQVICDGVRSLRTAARFMRYNAMKLNQECRGRNMFLPVWLGGLGVLVPDGWRLAMTPQQRRKALQLLEQEKLNDEHVLVPRVGPLNKYQIPFTDHEPIVEHWTVRLRNLDRDKRDWTWRASKEQVPWPRRLKKALGLYRVANAALGCAHNPPKRCDDPLNTSVPSSESVVSRDCTEEALFDGGDEPDFLGRVTNVVEGLLARDVQSHQAEDGHQNKQ